MPADALVPTTADAPAACRPRSDVGIGQRGRVSSVLPSQFPSLERTFDSRILVGMWYKPNVAARRRGLAMICSCRIFISSRSVLTRREGEGAASDAPQGSWRTEAKGREEGRRGGTEGGWEGRNGVLNGDSLSSQNESDPLRRGKREPQNLCYRQTLP